MSRCNYYGKALFDYLKPIFEAKIAPLISKYKLTDAEQDQVKKHLKMQRRRLFRIVQGLRMRRKNHGMPTMVLPLVTRMGYMYTRKTSKLNHVLVPLCAIMIGAFIFGCANAPSDAESVILPETLSDINFNNRCLTEEEFDGVVSNIEMLVSSLDSFCSTNIINRSTLLKSIKRRPIVSQKHRNVAYLISRYAGEHVGVMFVVDSRDIVRRVVTFHGIE
jgi:hypothetical protein